MCAGDQAWAALPVVKQAIQALATDTAFWFDDVWTTDSLPYSAGVPVRRSNARTWRDEPVTATAALTAAGTGACAFFLVCTPAGMPITWALASPGIDIAQRILAMAAAIWHNHHTAHRSPDH
jgi:hypothetical protein